MINFLLAGLVKLIPWRTVFVVALAALGATLMGVDLLNLLNLDGWTWTGHTLFGTELL